MGDRGPKSAASLAIVPPQPEAVWFVSSGDKPLPPAHLSDESAAWWKAVVDEWVLEPHQVCLLRAACESWDRCQQAREAVTAQGLTFKDDKGCIRANPAVAIERDARRLFTQILREMDLDGQPAPDRRPPRLARNAG